MDKTVSPQGTWVFVWWMIIFFSWSANVDANPLRVKIVAPYIELHTGPGRGYPVFHVATRGELINVLKARADWYKIQTDDNKIGWVTLNQLESTLTSAGNLFRSPKASFDDYLTRHFEVGAAIGELQDDPIMATRLAYFWHRNLGAEIALTQVAGAFASSQLYNANLVVAPFSNWRISPFFTIGLGRLVNNPKSTLVDANTTNSTTAIAGIGIRTYLARNFILRADVSANTVLIDDDQIEEFISWSGGFSFFIK